MRIFEIVNKEIIITTLFILLTLSGYVFFPAKGFFQYRAVAVVFLIMLPILYNKFFLKQECIFKKINIGDWRKNTGWLFLGLLGSLIIMFLIFKYTGFLNHYRLGTEIRTDFGKFLLYELTGVSVTIAIYEFFFRGFVQFYFVRYLEKWAIFVQFLSFGILLLFLQLPFWFYVGYLVFTPFGGWIAYKSNSILYSFSAHLFFMILMDASAIALTAKNL